MHFGVSCIKSYGEREIRRLIVKGKWSTKNTYDPGDM
jgi:hypothetical protein